MKFMTRGLGLSGKTKRRFIVSFVTVCALAAAFSILIINMPGLSAQEKVRESETCLDCHEGQQSKLLGTPHQILSKDFDKALVACTDCHVGDSRHYEDDPEQYPMTRPSDLSAWDEAQICSQCHENSHQQNMVERNVHMANNVNCSGCHRIHVVHNADSTYGEGQYSATHYAGLLKNNEVDLCLSCHSNVRGELHQTSHHPVTEGIVKCTDCHMITDVTKRPLSIAGTNAACVQCHNEFQMPFPYEHQATVGYSTQEGGCLNCHNPHGSPLPRLLNQPNDAPPYLLCMQCHTVPKHNFNSFHGAQWAGKPCQDCHADIHGSYTSHLFFSPAMQGQYCFNVGCHQF